MNFDLFSEPPPFAAIVTSMVSPGTSSKCMTAGVLSRVFLRVPAGSATIDARSRLSGWLYARRTPSLTMSVERHRHAVPAHVHAHLDERARRCRCPGRSAGGLPRTCASW